MITPTRLAGHADDRSTSASCTILSDGDITVERIGHLLDYDMADLCKATPGGAAVSSATSPGMLSTIRRDSRSLPRRASSALSRSATSSLNASLAAPNSRVLCDAFVQLAGYSPLFAQEECLL